MVIWRYNDDGTLDTSFNGQGWVVDADVGSGGLLVHDNAAGGGGDDQGLGVALDGSGRVVVVGDSLGSSSNLDMVIWRVR